MSLVCPAATEKSNGRATAGLDSGWESLTLGLDHSALGIVSLTARRPTSITYDCPASRRPGAISNTAPSFCPLSPAPRPL